MEGGGWFRGEKRFLGRISPGMGGRLGGGGGVKVGGGGVNLWCGFEWWGCVMSVLSCRRVKSGLGKVSPILFS